MGAGDEESAKAIEGIAQAVRVRCWNRGCAVDGLYHFAGADRAIADRIVSRVDVHRVSASCERRTANETLRGSWIDEAAAASSRGSPQARFHGVVAGAAIPGVDDLPFKGVIGAGEGFALDFRHDGVNHARAEYRLCGADLAGEELFRGLRENVGWKSAATHVPVGVVENDDR